MFIFNKTRSNMFCNQYENSSHPFPFSIEGEGEAGAGTSQSFTGQ